MDILNEKIEGLVNKAEKSKMPYGILKKVYDRGMAAWKTGHRPGTTPQQWAFARVNSFITKSSGTWGKADADLAKQVRGEEVQEKRTTAKGILGQIIKEARYEIGFTKGEVDMVISDRPGELAMIVQDELDSERIRAKVKSTGDEFTLEFNTNIPQRKMLKILDDKFGYTAFAEQIKEKLSKNADAGDYIDDFKKSDAPQFKGKSDKKKEKMAVAAYLDSKEEVKEENCPKCNDDPCKCENIQESGHTDVASMKTQVQIATDALQKMNTELGKLSDEEDLPTWWTNKVASAVGKLDGMADYIDAKHQQGEKMNEAPRQLEDPKKETMVMKKKDVKSIMVIDKKDLQKYTSKGYIQVESNDVELNIESLDKEDEKSVKKVIKGLKKAVDAHSGQVKSLTKDIKDEVESNLQEKEMTYTVVHVKKGKEVIKAKSSYDAAKKFAKMKGLSSTAGVDAHLMEGNITEQTVFVVRFEKEGLRFATPFHDMKRAKEGEIILKKTPGVSYIKITKDVLKPGIFLNNPVKEGVIVKEENLSVNLMEFDGTITIDTKNSSISKQLAYHLRYDLPSEFDVPLEMDGGEQGDTHFFMSPDMDNRDVKKFAAYLKKKYGNSIKLQLEGVEQVQEVLDNSLMAQATRVISQTAIKEKLDPLDVDNVATQDDRKAADKNIIIQLRRAQDMKGRADVTFKDNPKKKVKIDINIINKALNMFDSMKPNDKIKMQTTIGKSYRDLLNTVKRGR